MGQTPDFQKLVTQSDLNWAKESLRAEMDTKLITLKCELSKWIMIGIIILEVIFVIAISKR